MSLSLPFQRERGSTLIEYVGLGAVSAMLVTAVGAAIDSALGERMSTAIVRALLSAVLDSPA